MNDILLITSPLQFVVLCITIVLNTLLAVLVLSGNPKSTTNRTFAVLSFIISAWLVVLYLSLNPKFASSSLLWARLSVFLATPMNFALYLLADAIPNSEIRMSKTMYRSLFFIALGVMLLNISPYAFKTASGSLEIIAGPGIIPFGLFSLLVTIASLYTLTKRLLNSSGQERKQIRIVVLGIVFMLALLFLSVLLPVLFFNNHSFIFLTPIYALVFLGMTAYAIVRYQLFELKVIAAEAFTVILSITLFAKIFISPTLSQKLVDGFIFVASVLFGELLIKSVRQEVKQREQLEILSKQLGEANNQLKVLDQARAEFITIASHQLRTPPATIKWYLSSILAGDYGKIPKEQQEIIDKTNRTNNSLISLIDDMLNVSRIERGKMEFLFEPANLLDLAKITFEQLEPIATEKKLKLTFKATRKKFPEIMVDKEKLRQVMNNMIDNAIKYTKQGSVNVLLELNDKEIKFSVTDTGKGFDTQEQGEIFEKYKRGKESIKQSAGLGLGLYVAKVIIDQHKGKIWAESPGPGKGSSFIFTVPINSGLSKTTLVDLANPNAKTPSA